MCGINPPDKKGVAHHLSYPTNYWLIPISQKISNNIITFVYRDCHQKAHTAETYEEYLADKLKQSGYCGFCKDFAPKIWKRDSPTNVPIPLCNNCVADLKEGRLIIVKSETYITTLK